MVCKNCQNPLLEADDYCNKCGAKVIRNRLTIGNLFEHISETFLNYDNKLLRTFIALFTKPDDVIGGYINGVRKTYVNPISYLGLALTLGGLSIFIMNKFFPESLDFSGMTIEGQEEQLKNTMYYLQEYYTLYMVIFVPIYALMSRVVFLKRKDFNYTEHIVFFMFIFAQLTLFSLCTNIIAGLLKIPGMYVGYYNIIIQVIYTAYCLKQLYKLSIQGIILRTLLFFGILLSSMLLIMIIGFITVLVFKDTEVVKSFLEAQKTAQETKGG